MSDEEEVVKPDRIGSMDPEVTKWRAPTPENKERWRRIFQLQTWIQNEAKKRFVEEEEIVRYAINHWSVKRDTARQYMRDAVKGMEKKGFPVYHA